MGQLYLIGCSMVISEDCWLCAVVIHCDHIQYLVALVFLTGVN